MIRDAVVDDLPRILVLCEEFYNATIHVGISPFCVHSTTQTLQYLIDGQDGVLVVFEDQDGIIRGMAAALIYPLYMTGELAGQELFWWCNKKGSGMGLLDELETQAKQKGAKTFIMISLDNLTPERLDDIYLSRGYQRFEHTYVKGF